MIATDFQEDIEKLRILLDECHIIGTIDATDLGYQSGLIEFDEWELVYFMAWCYYMGIQNAGFSHNSMTKLFSILNSVLGYYIRRTIVMATPDISNTQLHSITSVMRTTASKRLLEYDEKFNMDKTHAWIVDENTLTGINVANFFSKKCLKKYNISSSTITATSAMTLFNTINKFK